MQKGKIHITFFTAILSLLSLFQNSCIVTDEIDFEEKINYPPQLVSATPVTDRINYSKPDITKKFTVVVQDPDKHDFNLYDGRISLIETLNSSVTTHVESYSCNEPETVDALSDSEELVLSITCQVTLRPSNENIKFLQVKVNISDRGYTAGNSVPDDARTLEVIWTYELVN